MSKAIRALARAAGAVAAAGGLMMAAALPASAASPNEAYAASATGLISASPIGLATFPGTSPVNIANANILGLLTTGVVTDQADGTSASATIANVAATLTPLVSLSAGAVTSSCSFNTNTGQMNTPTVTITNGVINTGLGTINLDASPTKNEVVAGLSGIATVTLNAQSTATDGTLTVTAIQISLIGTTQTLNLGTSVCNAANLAPVPILPGAALPLTLGGLILLATVVAAWSLSRRRRLVVAAR